LWLKICKCSAIMYSFYLFSGLLTPVNGSQRQSIIF
jgi:hypothetical protein